ncbi:MAG: hypothetical protein WC006_01315 [Bacilli bacterium]|nr:hypothetical protein [Bacilli bacterium]
MSENIELLNFIYQNSQMGVVTIKQLMEIVQEDSFLNCIQSQYNEYEEINKAALKLLNENGYDEKGISAFEKIKTYLMINIQTITNKTSSHIAEMLIIGSNMGIINAIKNLKKYTKADQEIQYLMQRLLKFEENNVQELKNYL